MIKQSVASSYLGVNGIEGPMALRTRYHRSVLHGASGPKDKGDERLQVCIECNLWSPPLFACLLMLLFWGPDHYKAVFLSAGAAPTGGNGSGASPPLAAFT